MQVASTIYPEIFLSALLVAILVLDLLGASKKILIAVFVVGLIVLLLLPIGAPSSPEVFGGMYGGSNPLPWLLIFGLSALLSVLSLRLESMPNLPFAETLSLILGTVLGMLAMTRTTHIVLLIVGAECVSFCAYGLVGLYALRPLPAVKYLIFGATVSAMALYAASWVYGYEGTLVYSELKADNPVVAILLGIVAISLVFKLAAFPLQQWMPDTVAASPAFVGAFVAVVPKAGAAIALERFVRLLLPNYTQAVGLVIGILVTLSLLVGHLSALWQKNIKTMLAYSSIAQAGFLLLGVVLGGLPLWFYVLAAVLMTFGAFWVAGILERYCGSASLSDLSKVHHPAVVVCAVVAVASLAGLPLTAGFTAKFLILASYWEKGLGWVLVVALLSLPLSWFYLLRLPYYLLLKPATVVPPILARVEIFTLWFFTIALIMMFLLPGWFLGLYDL